MCGKAIVVPLPPGLYYAMAELDIMAEKLGDETKEQTLTRMQRKELKAEVADNYARLPRRPRNRRRIITFGVLGSIALLAGIFGRLILLPSPAQQPVAGVVIGTEAPNFTLQIMAVVL